MVPAQHLQSVAELAVGRMLNGVVEGVLIALCGWMLLRAMWQQNSNTRFAVLLATLAAVASLPIIGRAYSNGVSTSAAHFGFLLPASWAIYIFLLWVLIAVAGLTKILVGFWQIHKLRRSCIPLNGDDPQLNELSPVLRTSNTNGFRRRIQICVSEIARVPAAIGFVKPIIVIPAWALQELTRAELNAVVLHELAHLRRWDDWTNLAQKIVGALLFFHPAVWWIDRGLAREREMACDDFVLAATADHRGYAKCLVSVAEKSFLRRSFSLAQAMAERMHLTAQRVSRILQGAHSADQLATTRVWKPAVAVMTAVSAVCLVSLAHEPNLVAFDNGSVAETAIAENQPHFEVKAIPAAFVVRNSLRTDRPVVRAIAAKHAVSRQPVPAVPSLATNTESLLPQRLVQNPVRVITARGQENIRATAPRSVLVIMQSNEIDFYGRVWSVSIWQLTVYHPDQGAARRNQKGVPPKST